MKRKNLLLLLVIFGAFFTLVSCSCSKKSCGCNKEEGETPIVEPIEEPIEKERHIYTQEEWETMVQEVHYNVTIDIEAELNEGRQDVFHYQTAFISDASHNEGSVYITQNGEVYYYTIVNNEVYSLAKVGDEWQASSESIRELENFVFDVNEVNGQYLIEYEKFQYDEEKDAYIYQVQEDDDLIELSVKVENDHIVEISYKDDEGKVTVKFSAIGTTVVELPVAEIMLDMDEFYDEDEWIALIEESYDNASFNYERIDGDTRFYSKRNIDVLREDDTYLTGVCYYESSEASYYVFAENAKVYMLSIDAAGGHILEMTQKIAASLFNISVADALTETLKEYDCVKYSVNKDAFVFEKMINDVLTRLEIKVEDEHIVSIDGSHAGIEYHCSVEDIASTVVELPDYELAPENANMNVNKNTWRQMLSKNKENFTATFYEGSSHTPVGSLYVAASLIGNEYNEFKAQKYVNSEFTYAKKIGEKYISIAYQNNDYKGTSVSKDTIMQDFGYEPCNYIDYYDAFRYNTASGEYEADDIDGVMIKIKITDGAVEYLQKIKEAHTENYKTVVYSNQGQTSFSVPDFGSPLSLEEMRIEQLRQFVLEKMDSATYKYTNITTSTLIEKSNVISYSTEYQKDGSAVITKELFDDFFAYYKQTKTSDQYYKRYVAYNNTTDAWYTPSAEKVEEIDRLFNYGEEPLAKMLALLNGECHCEQYTDSWKLTGKTANFESCQFIIYFDSNNNIVNILFEYLGHRGELYFTNRESKVTLPHLDSTDGLTINASILDVLLNGVGYNYTATISNLLDLFPFDRVVLKSQIDRSYESGTYVAQFSLMVGDAISYSYRDNKTGTYYSNFNSDFVDDSNLCLEDYKVITCEEFYEINYYVKEKIESFFDDEFTIRYDTEDYIFEGEYILNDINLSYRIHVKNDKIHYIQVQKGAFTFLCEFTSVKATNVNIPE